MTDRKSAEYIARAERASAEVATWPGWMQRNLEPTRAMEERSVRFPDVKVLGHVDADPIGRFVIIMVREDWEPDDGHDTDHAQGGCHCPCFPPLDAILDAAAETA